MNKTAIITIGVLTLAIIVLSILLYRAGRVGTTVITPGDTSYHKPVSSTPVQTHESAPKEQGFVTPPVIVYLPDTGGNRAVDTTAIKQRYQVLVDSLKFLLTEYKTERSYTDTVNDTAARVRAIIKDRVTKNRLDTGRTVAFMNLRPISIKMTTAAQVNLFHWNAGAFLSADAMQYKNLIYKLSTEVELGLWRFYGRFEPNVTIEQQPRLGAQIKVGYRFWGN